MFYILRSFVSFVAFFLITNLTRKKSTNLIITSFHLLSFHLIPQFSFLSLLCKMCVIWNLVKFFYTDNYN